jgi:uncharacterized protein RhaS with RHS repeats
MRIRRILPHLADKRFQLRDPRHQTPDHRRLIKDQGVFLSITQTANSRLVHPHVDSYSSGTGNSFCQSREQLRFSSQDPIRLAGGSNLAAYAPNPVEWVDPLGLSCKYTVNSVENPGPLADLPDRPAANFAGGKYNQRDLQRIRFFTVAVMPTNH